MNNIKKGWKSNFKIICRAVFSKKLFQNLEEKYFSVSISPEQFESGGKESKSSLEPIIFMGTVVQISYVL